MLQDISQIAVTHNRLRDLPVKNISGFASHGIRRRLSKFFDIAFFAAPLRHQAQRHFLVAVIKLRLKCRGFLQQVCQVRGFPALGASQLQHHVIPLRAVGMDSQQLLFRQLDALIEQSPAFRRLFDERIKLAEEELLGVHPNCPEWYYVMLQLGRAQGWEAADLTDLLQKAAAFEPEFYYTYQEVALGLMPQWRGKEGDVEKFTEASANAVGGKAGDILYWQITQSIMSNRDLGNILQHLSWSRAMLGYQALIAQYGVTPVRQNQLALMAARFGDYMVADETLTQIGDRWDAATWGTREYFDKIRIWARSTAVPVRNMIEAYK